LKSLRSRRIVILQTEAHVWRVDGLPHIVSQPIIPRFPLICLMNLQEHEIVVCEYIGFFLRLYIKSAEIIK
jgi:hypothetical protein